MPDSAAYLVSDLDAERDGDVLWDVLAEHLDEAEFLCDQRERALESPSCTLTELEETLESRLHAHIDALVEAGPQVIRHLLEPELCAADCSESRAAVIGLAMLALADHESLGRCLARGGCVTRGLERALFLGGTPASDEWVVQSVAGPLSKDLRISLLRVAATRGLVIANLLAALQSDDLEELVAATRAALWADPTLHAPVLEYLIQHNDPEVADAALVACMASGSRAFPEPHHVRKRMPGANASSMMLLALRGDAQSVEVLKGQFDDPALREGALFALGFAGRVDLSSLLLGQLHDEDARIRKLAAEAFANLSGLDTSDARYWLPDLTDDSDELPELEDDLQRDLAPSAVDELALPDSRAIASWWGQHAHERKVSGNMLMGQPWTLKSSLSLLESFPMRRRAPLALWLLLRYGRSAHVATRAFSTVQRAQLLAVSKLGEHGRAR